MKGRIKFNYLPLVMKTIGTGDRCAGSSGRGQVPSTGINNNVVTLNDVAGCGLPLLVQILC